MRVCLHCGQRFESEDWRCPDCGQCPEHINGFLAFSPDLAEAVDCFDGAYFAQADTPDAVHFWYRGRQKLLIWALRRYFSNARSFFEIGCRSGFVLSGIKQELPEIKLYGSDILVRGLVCRKKELPEVSLFEMDARAIPFEREFDVIGAFDLLEHIEEDNATLSQMFQATAPGGGILLTVPQHRFLWSIVDEYSHHKRRYTRSELVKKVERSGFQIILVTSFVSLILPFMLVSRIRQNRSQKSFDPLAEFRLPHFLNASFEKIMGIERSLIMSGLSFPFGSSLLLVGRRHTA